MMEYFWTVKCFSIGDEQNDSFITRVWDPFTFSILYNNNSVMFQMQFYCCYGYFCHLCVYADLYNLGKDIKPGLVINMK